MRRMLKVLAWCVAVLVVVPTVLVGAVLLGANTGPGRQLIETLAPRFTDGEVRIEGFGGRFPDAVRVRRITIADPTGIWLTVDDAALDWTPLRLLEGEIAISLLQARTVTVARLPAATSSNSSSGGSSIPRVRAVLSRLQVARLDIGPAVAGQPIVLAVDGAGEMVAPDTGEAHLAVTALQPRNASPLDHYLVEAAMTPSHLHATLSIAESPHGLIAGLAKLPDLGAIAVTGSVDGPLSALATKATIAAGSLRGNLEGSVNVMARDVDLVFSVVAPAMTPRPGVGWSLIRLDGKAHGPFTAPAATATLAVDNLIAAGGEIGSLRADVSGDATGKTELHASFDGLRVPGPSPDVLAAGPLTLDASIQLADPNRPASFAVQDALFSAVGTADVMQGQVRLTLPDLTPFAAIGGVALQGHSELNIAAKRTNQTIDLTVAGGVGIGGGMQPVPALIGGSGTINLAASLQGDNVRVSRFVLGGSHFNATVHGQYVDSVLNADWTVALNDLTAIQPDLNGAISAHGRASGPLTSLSISSDLTGNLAAKGERLEQVSAHLAMSGLPDAPTGQLTAGGTLLDAPLNVAIAAERQAGGVHIVIDRASWNSLAASGTLDVAAGNTLPTGKLSLSMTRLADLAPLVGQPIAGSIKASLDSSSAAVRLSAVVTNAAVPAVATVANASVDATITSPMDHPLVDGTFTLDGLEAGGVRASGRLAAKGPMDGIELKLAANSAAVQGLPARIETSGTLNATAKILSLASLQGVWGRETLRLLAPARIEFAQGIAVDKLNLGFRQGGLLVAGRWGGAANGAGGGTVLNVKLTNLPADILAQVAPAYAADGTISGEARLTGSPARPEGAIDLHASGVRLRSGNGRALPAAAATINVALAGTSARLNASLTAGRSDVTAAGKVPLDLTGAMDVRVGGAVELAMFNPLLTAQGREVRGRLALGIEVTGTPGAPVPGGTVRLSNGDVQDSSLGVHISAITAAAQFAGKTVQLEQFAGKAGQGTISCTGTVGLTDTPTLDLSLRANNARLLSSEMIASVINANLTVRGALNGGLTLAGTVTNRTTNIQIPEKLPPSIAVLPVRVAGAPPPKPSPPATVPDISLNLTLDAPGQIYVRGRGLDAELGGRVVFTGTAANPVPQGALNLRRGTFSLAGQTLNLTSGTIDFTGGPLTNPSLKFVATTGNATLTSTLTISGSVKDPKIALSSVPDMPQDEILSQLLFNQAKAGLNPFQVAEIVAALAEISGVGPSGGDPLGGVRSALGLDQLSVGSGANGGTALQAGRYLAPGVRVGASQSASGAGTAATVQIDLAKGLKLQTSVGTGSASAAPSTSPGTPNGTGIGLTYQFNY